LGISVSEGTQDLILDVCDVICFKGGSDTIRIFLGHSELVSLHDITGLSAFVLTSVSVGAINIASIRYTHCFATLLGEPFVSAVVVLAAGFTVTEDQRGFVFSNFSRSGSAGY